MNIFENDVIEHIKSDLQKIRIKSGMYIGYSGWRATNHLAREIIQNSIDECLSPKSPGRNIDIVYDEDTKIFKCSDDGRGIPIDSILLATCSLNSGSKFTREQSGASAGENGVGLKGVAALSETFYVTTHNNGSQMTLKFIEAELENASEPKSTKSHGLTCEFKPSVKALYKNPWLKWNELVSWVKNISYLLGTSKKITFHMTNGKQEITVVSSEFSKIIGELVNRNHVTTPIAHLHDSIDVSEKYFDRDINRKIDLEVLMLYSTQDTNIVSFANIVNTIDHGSHVDGIKESISRYLSKLTSDSLSEREKKALQDIKWSDCIDGLILIVKLSTDHSLGFASQSKSKIESELIYNITKSMMTKMLQEYLDKNSKVRASFIERVKINAKTRLSLSKTKEQLIKPLDRYEESRVAHYKRCTDDKSEDKEIFLIEGDSAMNAASAVRNPKNQALFGMIGIPANGMKRNDDTIFKNERFDSLVKILGCGRGKNFKLENLKFKKIIMLTDADVDGYYIRSLFSGFFMTYFPDIVKDGRLYAAVPPLYRIKLDSKKRSKDDDLVTDKIEYMKLFNRILAKKYRLGIGDRILSSEEMVEFLYDAKWYLKDLMEASNMFKSNRKLIEMIWYMYAKDSKFSPEYLCNTKYIGILQSEFEHIKYEPSTKIIYGVIDGKYQSIAIGSLLFNRGNNYCIPLMRKYNTMYVDMHVGTSMHTMTIGEFLSSVDPDKPKILTRFKGLGEFEDRTDLQYTTMDPNTRNLLQLTIDDYDNDLAILEILHGNSEDERAIRKDKVHNYVIDRDQIDT